MKDAKHNAVGGIEQRAILGFMGAFRVAQPGDRYLCTLSQRQAEVYIALSAIFGIALFSYLGMEPENYIVAGIFGIVIVVTCHAIGTFLVRLLRWIVR